MRPHALIRRLVTAFPSIALLVSPAVGMTDTVVRLEPFQNLTLRNGGLVILRHGATQRVTVREGHEQCVIATIEEGRLVIDSHHENCSRRHRMVVEVVVPEIDAIAVTDGGTIQSSGDFPRQSSLNAAVTSGGTIDLRPMSVDHVNAAIQSGGRIFTMPREALNAAVAHGGIITYWGKPRVSRSIAAGGVVSRGAVGDAGKSLDELGPTLQDVPPVPPVPPLPPSPVRGS